MMQSSDTTPDIYIDDSFQAVSDAAAGYLMDMSEALSNWDTWTNGSFPEATKNMFHGENGGVYGIPYCTDCRGLWANTEILAQAGLPDDWQPTTWQELLASDQAERAGCDSLLVSTDCKYGRYRC